jgi:hypothetical protein
MITYLGSLSIGACMPQVTAGIAAAFADLQARVTALLAFNPAPIDFHAQLAIAVQMQANLSLAISLGLPVPSISAQIAIVASLVAALEAQLAIILNLQNALGAAGVFAYAYQGRADAFGGELAITLATGFPGGLGADNTNALVLATTTPATWTALQLVFKTSP